MTRAVWSDFSKKRFFIYKSDEDTDPVELGVGDTITWEGRSDFSKVTGVAGHASSIGPIGFSYLPYREGRWARGSFTLRGDARFVICYPTGAPHYGIHLPLHTIRKDEAPLYKGPPGEITMTFDDALVELRSKLVNAGNTMNLVCTVSESTYSFSTDTIEFRVCISRSDGYRVDLYHVRGDPDMKSFSELL